MTGIFPIIAIAALYFAFACMAGAFLGCASSVQRFNYGRENPNALIKRIIIADPDEIDGHCRKYASHYDDGTRPHAGDGRQMKCCFRGGDHRTMYVSNQDYDCMAHEICHAMGFEAKFCDKFHVKK